MTMTYYLKAEIIEAAIDYWIGWNYCVGFNGYENRVEWLDEDWE